MKKLVGNLISDLLASAIGYLLIPVFMGIGVAVLAWLQTALWFHVALAFVATAALTLWGTNQYFSLRDRRKKQFIHRSNAEAEKVLTDWLYKQKFTIQQDPQPNVLFQFSAKNAQNRPIIVTRVSDRDPLMIWSRIVVRPEDKDKFASLKEPIRSKMISDLRIEMARFGISFTGINHPLQEVRVIDYVPFNEELTETLFLTRVMFVARALVLITELVGRAIRQSREMSGQES